MSGTNGALRNTLVLCILVTTNSLVYEYLLRRGGGQKNSVIIESVVCVGPRVCRVTLLQGRRVGDRKWSHSRGTTASSLLLFIHSLALHSSPSADIATQPASFFYTLVRPKTTIETEGRRHKPVDSAWNRSFQCQSFPPKRGTCHPAFAMKRSGVGIRTAVWLTVISF